MCSSLGSSAQDLLHGFFKILRSCTKAQACCQHGQLKPAYPQRRWASMSLTQEVPPGMSPRRWTQGSSTPTTLLGPSKYHSTTALLHIPPSTFRNKTASLLLFSRDWATSSWEELLALVSHVAGTTRRCCPSREPGGNRTDRIAGDSSGELDLAPLPGSSQTLLAWHKLLPHTCLAEMEINCKAKEVPGGSRSEQGWLEGIEKSRRWLWLNGEEEQGCVPAC